jgi:sulfite reductase (NADPH) hemoprotein beta-component
MSQVPIVSTPSAAPSPGAPPRSFADPRDLEAFVRELERWERGEINAEEWKAFRLLYGNYGQRQEGDLYMLRSKLPQGAVTAAQLEALGEVAEEHSRGFGHVTTRQNLQLHFVTGRGVAAALERLAEAGVTSREACGNAVRNVTACPYGGVSPDEIFDTTPYGEALTRYFLRHPLSSSLPRKFKIAFEGCAEDHAATGIHDIGFLARREGGRRGFEVRLAGGTATFQVTGRRLLEFVPAGELLAVAEAVVRVFHRLGERKNRNAARMKYLVKKLGWDAFEAEVRRALEEVRAEGVPPLPFDPERPSEEGPPAARAAAPAPAEIARRVKAQVPRGPGVVPEVRPAESTPAGLAAWTRTNVRPQRQSGFAIAIVTLPLGDLTSAQLGVLAELSRAYADGTVRFTKHQDAVLRWVAAAELPALHARLSAAGLGLAGAETPAKVVSCPGAESCRLAVTHSRGLGRELEALLRARPELTERLGDADIKMSGCPNGCSQHHIAAIGLQGSVRKVGDKVVPQYFVLLGGGVDREGARFGELAAKIPARRVGQALERLAALYQERRRPDEGARAFFARLPAAEAKAALADLAALTPETLAPEDVVDLGEDLAAPVPGAPAQEGTWAA